MPTFLNLHKQRVGANVNKDVDLSGFGEAVARTVNNQKLKSFNSSMADIAQRAIADPHGASVDAFRAGNQQFGAALFNQAMKVQGDAKADMRAEKNKLAQMLASGSFKNDTEEEWSAFVTSLEKRFGKDLSKYKPFDQREVVISEAMTYRDRLNAQGRAQDFAQKERHHNDRMNKPRARSTVEKIRQKIAAGQDLTKGEKRVYDDALKADPTMRLLQALQSPENTKEESEATTGSNRIQQEHIEMLRANKDNAKVVEHFNELYGNGAAEKILGE